MEKIALMRRMMAVGIMIIVCCFATTETALARPVRGILVDGFGSTGVVFRNDSTLDCVAGMKLYDGDEILVPFPDRVSIAWLPGAKGVIGEGKVKVVYQKPRRRGLFSFIGDFFRHLGAGSKPQGRWAYSPTRGPEDAKHILPGIVATLLPGESVKFAWGGAKGATALIITDAAGTEILRRSLAGANWLDIRTEELGLKPGAVYTWKIAGINSALDKKLSLAAPEWIEQIQQDLQAIDENGEGDKNLRKAAYLQMVSDAYADEIDFYWLSYDYLKKVDDSLKEGDEFQKLWERFLIHTRE